MEYAHLSETVKFRTISADSRKGVFEFEGLYTGYGTTIGNALRRTLLSSLPGAAVTQIKIKGVDHEFSTLPGVVEDMVEITLNLKQVRFRCHSSEPQVLSLKVKGESEVTAGDIKLNSDVEVIDPKAHIATLTQKNAELDMEITVERGLGYASVEDRKMEKLPVKTIAIDAIFTPVLKVNFLVENMRVGDRTDYNRLTLEIETDGSITPIEALHKAGKIMSDHFAKVAEFTGKNNDEEISAEAESSVSEEAEEEKKPAKKKAKK